MSKIWLVEHPTHQFEEDVKALAKAKGLQVINADFAESFDKKQICENPPKLTKKSELKKAKANK
tara:strand:- start:157 stop:348 length:192 start_codon:yes stop_codon:yes gene_type:complete